VDTTPFLGQHSVILQQAVLENPPMFPDEVFQQILEVAYKSESEAYSGQQPEMESPQEPSSMDPWEDSEFLEGEETQQQTGQKATKPQESLSSLWESASDAESQNDNPRIPNAS